MRQKWKTRKHFGGSKKTVDLYKSILSSFAYTDAKHDFGGSSKDYFYENHMDSIKDSIPDAPYTEYNEEELLKSIKITHINDEVNEKIFNIDNIIKDGNLSFINILDLLISGKITRQYDIKVIYYQKDEKVIADTENFLYHFNGLRTFIVDSFNLKFFDGFKHTDDTSYYNKDNTFYVLYNREMENDPANKGQLKKKHFAHNGYRLQNVYDIDTNDITYSMWNDNKLINKNMFYSKYNLTLTNINKVELKIDDGINNIGVYDNLKINNSIENLKTSSNNGTIIPSIAFTRKRCGDSLQVLSTFDNNRKLYSNDKDDTDLKIHSTPKMIISLDRLVLYYSLLMGVDIGFTVKRKNNDGIYDYYLINFMNTNNKFTLNEPKFNYSKNKIVGGRNYTRNKSIKLKRNNKRTIKHNIKKNNKMNNNDIQESYNQIILPEIEEYIIRNKLISEYSYAINPIIKKFNTNPEYKQTAIKYIKLQNNIEYTKEYVSRLIYWKYLETTEYLPDVYIKNKDTQYDLKIEPIRYITSFYKHLKYDDIMTQLLTYYDEHDIEFANNIRSLNCLLWIIQCYKEMESERTFNNYDEYALEDLMTPALQKIYDEQTSYEYKYKEGETENTILKFSNITIKRYIWKERMEQLISIIREMIDKNWKNDTPEMKEINDIYEQICYTSSWDFTDLSRIISYINKHNLDVYNTLLKLADDYDHAMYKVKPNVSGPQSTAGGVLTELDYDYDGGLDRTPEVQLMVDEIDSMYDMYSMGSISQYRQSFSELLGLFKKTFEKHLIWGIDII